MRPYMIAVAGGSGSGKTTFVKRLQDNLGDVEVLVLHIDHYYKDLSPLTPAERDLVNYDHPDAIERDLFLEHVGFLRQGKPCMRPTYDFASHTRKDPPIKLEPKPVIIIDGIFSLHDDRLFPLLDLKLFVDADQDLRLARRVKRDLQERGRSLEGTFEQYFKTVKPMHLQFIEPSKFRADFIVPWHDYNVGAVALVGRIIRESIEGRKL